MTHLLPTLRAAATVFALLCASLSLQAQDTIWLPRQAGDTIVIQPGHSYVVAADTLYRDMNDSLHLSFPGSEEAIAEFFFSPNTAFYYTDYMLLSDDGSPSDIIYYGSAYSDQRRAECLSLNVRNALLLVQTLFYTTTETAMPLVIARFFCAPAHDLYDIACQTIEPGRHRIRWQDSSSCDRWVVQYRPYLGDTIYSISTATPSVELFMSNVPMEYRVLNCSHLDNTSPECMAPWAFVPNTPASCINYCAFGVDTTIQCMSGTCNGSSCNTPILMASIHVDNPDNQRIVVLDHAGLDSKTDNRLSLLPPNGMPSVRLGDKKGALQESVTYPLHVDTNDYALLIVHYAIVFQNPNHPRELQPHVTIEILGQDNLLLNATCGQADFYAGTLSGWQDASGSIQWKDWDALGIDLSPYHGMDIQVRIHNRDCTLGAHYSYTYYAIECAQKILRSNSCGPTAGSIYTAPAGFRYRWYEQSRPDVTLGTSQQFQLPADGLYFCRASFLADALDQCGFTLQANSQALYPWAEFSYEEIESGDSCAIAYRFSSQCKVSSSPDSLIDLHMPIESVLWDFGDGTTSTQDNPVHLFMPGTTPTIMLTAIMGGGACRHSDSVTLVLPGTPCRDTLTQQLCPGQCVTLFGHTYCEPGQYEVENDLHLATINLLAGANTASSVTEHIAEGELPWHYEGHTFLSEVSDLEVHTANSQGCDSAIAYTLVIHYNKEQAYDTAVCAEHFPFAWHDTLFLRPDTLLVHKLGSYGQDSNERCSVSIRQVSQGLDTLTLCRWQTFVNSGIAYDTVGTYPFHHLTPDGCDSICLTTLKPSSLHAGFIASPNVASSDESTIRLTDTSCSSSQMWDVMGTIDFGRHISFSYPEGQDSVVCTLYAEDEHGCRDTATAAIHYQHNAVWLPNIFIAAPGQEFRVRTSGVKDIEVKIYDRNGLLACCWRGLDGYWDGTMTGSRWNAHGGKPCEKAAYVCQVRYTLHTSPQRVNCHTATVTLLR